MARKTTPGVLYRHVKACDGTCAKSCNDSQKPWEAWVFDAKYVDPKTGRRGKKIRRRFGSHAEAKKWRADAAGQLRHHKLRAVDAETAQRTLGDEIASWLAGARDGSIRNKREQPYKPAVIRSYELSLRLRVEPVLGDRRLSDITLYDLLRLKEDLLGSGCSDSTVRNTFVPLQAIYRRARRLGLVTDNPTLDLGLPTAGSRDRAATPNAAQRAARRPFWFGAGSMGNRVLRRSASGGVARPESRRRRPWGRRVDDRACHGMTVRGDRSEVPCRSPVGVRR